jgi:transcription antitermination factor NusG
VADILQFPWIASGPPMSHWYLVYTKLRQETQALERLQALGIACFHLAKPRDAAGEEPLPAEPLLPRLLLVQISEHECEAQLDALRTVTEISGLVRGGASPVAVDDVLVNALVRSAGQGAALRARTRPGQQDADAETSRAIETLLRLACPEARRALFLELAGRFAETPARLRLRAS